jgi:hypothetical protein
MENIQFLLNKKPHQFITWKSIAAAPISSAKTVVSAAVRPRKVLNSRLRGVVVLKVAGTK